MGGIVSTITHAVEDLGGAVVGAVRGVAKTVEDTVQAAIKDPIGTAAKIATAIYAPELLPAVNLGDAVARGQPLDKALLNTGINYITGEIVGGTDLKSTVTADYGATAGNLAQSAATGALNATIKGGDPLQGAVASIINKTITNNIADAIDNAKYDNVLNQTADSSSGLPTVTALNNTELPASNLASSTIDDSRSMLGGLQTAAADTDFTTDVSGAAGTAETPQYAKADVPTGTQLATIDQINSGQARWDVDSNSWIVNSPPVESLDPNTELSPLSTIDLASQQVAPVTLSNNNSNNQFDTGFNLDDTTVGGLDNIAGNSGTEENTNIDGTPPSLEAVTVTGKGDNSNLDIINNQNITRSIGSESPVDLGTVTVTGKGDNSNLDIIDNTDTGTNTGTDTGTNTTTIGNTTTLPTGTNITAENTVTLPTVIVTSSADTCIDKCTGPCTNPCWDPWTHCCDCSTTKITLPSITGSKPKTVTASAVPSGLGIPWLDTSPEILKNIPIENQNFSDFANPLSSLLNDKKANKFNKLDASLADILAKRGYSTPFVMNQQDCCSQLSPVTGLGYASGGTTACCSSLYAICKYAPKFAPSCADLLQNVASKNRISLALQQLKQMQPYISVMGNMGGLASGGLPKKYQDATPDGHNPEFVTGLTGYYANGRGTGQSDDIPALLHDGDYVMDAETVSALGDGSSKAGREVLDGFMHRIPHSKAEGGKVVPAKIADGEYVFPAAFVTALGSGDNKHGSKILDGLREKLRAHKRSAPTNKIPPKAKSPLEYIQKAKR